MQLYQSGIKNFLDVQTAHRLFLTSEETLLQGQIDLLMHFISLYKSLGGGWETCSCQEECW